MTAYSLLNKMVRGCGQIVGPNRSGQVEWEGETGLSFKDPQAYCRSYSTGDMQSKVECMRTLLQ